MRRVRQGFAALESALGRFAVTSRKRLSALRASPYVGRAISPLRDGSASAQIFKPSAKFERTCREVCAFLVTRFERSLPVLAPLWAVPMAQPAGPFPARCPRDTKATSGLQLEAPFFLVATRRFRLGLSRMDDVKSLDGRLTGMGRRLGWAPDLIVPAIVISQGGEGACRGCVQSAEEISAGPHTASTSSLSDLCGFLDGALDVSVELPRPPTLKQFPRFACLGQLRRFAAFGL